MAEHRFVRYGVLGLVAALAAGLIWIGLVRYQAERRAFQAEAAAPAVSSAAPMVPAAVEPVPAPAPQQPEFIFVHVAGAVAKPGVYSLNPGARVDDAIAAAGGPLPDGVKDALSLAEHLVDGQKIVVPTKRELEEAPPPVAAAATASASTAKPPVARANVNTATVKQLDALPGVTPTVAQNIVDYRAKNGPFKKFEDLDKVSGIGPATIEKLRPYLTF